MSDLPIKIFAKLRVSHLLPVAETTRAVGERLLEDPAFADLITWHEQTTTHFAGARTSRPCCPG